MIEDWEHMVARVRSVFKHRMYRVGISHDDFYYNWCLIGVICYEYDEEFNA